MNASQDRRQTRATYDFLSRWYDLLSGPAEDRARQQAVELLDIRAGDIILEIGSGTGSSSVEMGSKVGSGGYVCALDLSSKMLDVAQRKLLRKGLGKRVGLVWGDAIHLPMPSHAVTGILISFTLELFAEAEISLVLAECRRVFRKGGRMCVLSMSRQRPNAPLIKPYEWLHEQFPAWFDCRPILLRQTLEKHGYRVIKARQSSIFGLPVETVLTDLNP
jgi:demethylmenaquinone methyltransferase/2-methoxy-6-polyprenyl-1,4-benzoquinol methylase